MKLPSLNPQDITPWLDKPEMIRACVAQLKKDVGSYGLEIEFSGDVYKAYEELFNQVEPWLSRLPHGTLMEVLYRVDVNESMASRVMQENESYHRTLTRLPLWRELQKVVTRFLLSEKKD